MTFVALALRHNEPYSQVANFARCFLLVLMDVLPSLDPSVEVLLKYT